MFIESEFDTIRPYKDSEVPEVLNRLRKDEAFVRFAQQLFPELKEDNIIQALDNIDSIEEFQSQFIIKLAQNLIKNTTNGVTIEGLDNLEKGESYLFISDHRDIILDSALLNVLLHENGFDTTEIAIGSNLLIQPWISDLVKLNKSFVVNRNISVRQMLESSKQLSSYIRYALSQKKSSIWIAQREGRTKDGDDRTQLSLLKMLHISGSEDFAANFKALRIVPVAISYEYEPCDAMKTMELYLKETDSKYQKTPKDDLRSMLAGLLNNKGRVHFSINKPIAPIIDTIQEVEAPNDHLKALAEVIDYRIHKSFKLWPDNYIAFDLLHSTNDFRDYYSDEEKDNFVKHMDKKLNPLEGNRAMLNKIFLEIYANPVKNRKELKKPNFVS